MKISTAIRLIKNGISESPEAQRWADLGAGDGFFTRALATTLPAQSSIVAVDQKASSLKAVPWNNKVVSLTTQVGNFTLMNWGQDFSGILMANALHYVQDQAAFLTELKSKLSREGRLLVVEYERKQANQWVPNPISFEKLNVYSQSSGFSSIKKLEEAPSVYGGATIYSAVLLS
jgi:ubiquinone/menaquinone biosynthesis C-methylase UbiE